ncbi:MAG: hypothetical protein Q7U86_09355, partial [Draconibacterium sp.]|nr:hypothetical protein [Draconibacterium sp.]
MEFEINHVEETKNYKTLKNQLEEALNKANQISDLKEAKGLLINVQSEFKGLKLLRDDREEFYKRLQDSFAEINQKIEEERNNFNHEALQNYSVIKVKVDEALFLATNPKEFKETWDFLIEVQLLFKSAKLLREHRESLYARLQEAFERIKVFRETEQNNLEKESTQNYIQLTQTIQEAINSAGESGDFREAKNELIRAQAEFRNARLTKEKRDELNSKLQDAFTMLNIRQEETFAKKRMAAEEQYNEFNSRAHDILNGAKESNEFNKV